MPDAHAQKHHGSLRLSGVCTPWLEHREVALQALALQSNGTLAALSLGHDLIGVANVKALAEAFEL